MAGSRWASEHPCRARRSRSRPPAGLGAAGYLVNGLHDLAGWLEPFRFLSSFWLVGSSPLQNGIAGGGMVAVLVAGRVPLGGGSLLVERRDLQTP